MHEERQRLQTHQEANARSSQEKEEMAVRTPLTGS